MRDLLDAMARDAKRPLARLRVDGGAAANDLLMQFQADVAGVVVERPSDIESTGRGAAMLAGFGAGIFKGFDEAARMVELSARFEPNMDAAERAGHLSRWEDAVGRARSSHSRK